MKIWIIGAQGAGKRELVSLLSKDRFKIGKLFTNNDPDAKIYNRSMYNFYDNEDIHSIFENNAYVFINSEKVGDFMYFEGLDLSEYDSNNVFCIGLDQAPNININYISKDDLVVWLDGDRKWRFNNIEESGAMDDYNHYEREKVERADYVAFDRFINSISLLKNMIYFFNEDPKRVKTIVKTIYNNPKLKNEFVKNFQG